MTDEIFHLLLWLFLVAGIGAALVYVLAAINTLYPWQRNVGVDEFPRILHIAFFQHQNGGIIQFRQMGSDMWFSFERIEGKGANALVALRIPRVTWQRARGANPEEVFGKHGFDFDSDAANKSLIGCIPIVIEDTSARSAPSPTTRT